MTKAFSFAALAAACAAHAAGALAAPLCAVPGDLWDRPRSGRAVLAVESFKPCVSAFLADPGARLVVRHGNSPEAGVQAEELRAWLLGLALDGSRIELDAGGSAAGLVLDVRGRR